MKQLASRHSLRRSYPPAVFEQVTDILAELVLDDLKQFPLLHPHPRIDRLAGRANTVSHTQTEATAMAELLD